MNIYLVRDPAFSDWPSCFLLPDAYLNRDFKTALRSGPVSHDKASLLDKAMAFMNTLGTLPDKVMAYFRHPAARYAMA